MEKLNVVLITNWLGGDVIPFLKMAKILKRSGYEVTLFTHCIYKEMAEKLGIKFVSLDELDEYCDMLKHFNMLSDPVNSPEDVINFNSEYLAGNRCLTEIKLIRENIDSAKTVFICRHRSCVSGLLAAEFLNIPVISVVLAPSYLAHMQFHEELVGKEITKQINCIRSKLELPYIHSWTEWMSSPKSIIGIWPQWFSEEEDVAVLPHIQLGGFINEIISDDPLPDGVVSFIKENPSFIIISGGTSEYLEKRFYEVAVKACASLRYSAICVCPYDTLVPDELPKNIIRTDYINLPILMKYAKLIIHHGGINTSSEAIYNKVPQLILAHMADRPDNGQRLQNSGLAYWLPVSLWTIDNVKMKILEMESELFIKNFYKSIDKVKNEKTFDELIIEEVNKIATSPEQYRVKMSQKMNVKCEEDDKRMEKNNFSEVEKNKLLRHILQKKKEQKTKK